MYTVRSGWMKLVSAYLFTLRMETDPVSENCFFYCQSFFFSLPTDAQVDFLKNNFKIHIKIDVKTAPTCFGAVTPSSGSALLILALASTSNGTP